MSSNGTVSTGVGKGQAISVSVQEGLAARLTVSPSFCQELKGQFRGRDLSAVPAGCT